MIRPGLEVVVRCIELEGIVTESLDGDARDEDRRGVPHTLAIPKADKENPM